MALKLAHLRYILNFSRLSRWHNWSMFKISWRKKEAIRSWRQSLFLITLKVPFLGAFFFVFHYVPYSNIKWTNAHVLLDWCVYASHSVHSVHSTSVKKDIKCNCLSAVRTSKDYLQAQNRDSVKFNCNVHVASIRFRNWTFLLHSLRILWTILPKIRGILCLHLRAIRILCLLLSFTSHICILAFIFSLTGTTMDMRLQ